MQKDRYFFWCVSGATLLLLTIPYLYAYFHPYPDYIFGGFLLNPIDGNSYLTKMYQGWEGHWSFKLLYNANPGTGAYLFVFYIFLGHLARLFSLPLILVFHIARLVGAAFLHYELYQFIAAIFKDPKSRKIAFVLSVIGSGAGWMTILGGKLSSDFWVAEIYPFLSSYSNPHFPISLALMLWLLKPKIFQEDSLFIHSWGDILVGCLLSILSPFGVVIVGIIEGILALWHVIEVGGRSLKYILSQLRGDINRLVGLILGGSPMLVYYLWVVKTNNIFSGWNDQNLTPAPPVWDLIISLSPVLLLSIFGMVKIYKDKIFIGRLLIVWVWMSLILCYAPLSLQRRFLMGIYIPLVFLTVYGLEWFYTIRIRAYRYLYLSILIASIPTNILIITAAKAGVDAISREIFISKGEAEALQWIANSNQVDSLILASPQTGLFIPAHTGKRVYYGHPYETINAKSNKLLVERFFMGIDSKEDIISLENTDYIFWGPREREFWGLKERFLLPVVYQNNDVTIYQWDIRAFTQK